MQWPGPALYLMYTPDVTDSHKPAQVVRWLSSRCNPLQVQERQLSPFHPPHKRIISNPKFMMMQPKTINRRRPLNKIHDEGEQGRKKLDKKKDEEEARHPVPAHEPNKTAILYQADY